MDRYCSMVRSASFWLLLTSSSFQLDGIVLSLCFAFKKRPHLPFLDIFLSISQIIVTLLRHCYFLLLTISLESQIWHMQSTAKCLGTSTLRWRISSHRSAIFGNQINMPSYFSSQCQTILHRSARNREHKYVHAILDDFSWFVVTDSQKPVIRYKIEASWSINIPKFQWHTIIACCLCVLWSSIENEPVATCHLSMRDSNPNNL
jgi:hypothetical protein